MGRREEALATIEQAVTRRTPQDDTAAAMVVPRSWQRPGPMVLANDKPGASAGCRCAAGVPEPPGEWPA